MKLHIITPNATINKIVDNYGGTIDKVQAYAKMDFDLLDESKHWQEYGFKYSVDWSDTDPSAMNTYRIVAFWIAPSYLNKAECEEYIALLKRRKGFEYYRNTDAFKTNSPLFMSYVLWDMPCVVDGKHVNKSAVSVDYALGFLEEMANGKALAQYTSRESVAYTRELVTLYNELNKLCNHRLPDFGTEELVQFLERMLRNSTNVDYRSAGKLMHYEKEHFYKFDKMSDFLNPGDVYTDKDNRIVWTTDKDRLGTHYVDSHLEDLLHEALTYRWIQLNDDYTPYIAWDDCDATSNEDVVNECVHNDIDNLLEMYIDGQLDDELMDMLATMINMHRDIFNQVCEERNIEFKLR